MTEHTLSDEAALDMLYDKVKWLEETIDAVDYAVANAIQAHDDGINLGDNLIARIQGEYQVKHDLMYKLGRASVHIEQLEERIERQRVQTLEEQRQQDTFAVLQNHLDWLEIDDQHPAIKRYEKPSPELER